jgi:hypothetical protein
MERTHSQAGRLMNRVDLLFVTSVAWLVVLLGTAAWLLLSNY